MQPWVPGKKDGRVILQPCVLAQDFNQREREVTKNKTQGAEMYGGKDGLASFGHGDVEIKFYISSCFIVPFIREQVQDHSDLLLLVKSHQNELHRQPV